MQFPKNADLPLASTNPRVGLSLKEQQKAVFEKEWIRLEVDGFYVTLKYPSDFIEVLPWDVFEDRYLKPFGIEEARKVGAYLINFKKIAHWPHERLVRIIMRDERGNEIFT